jgi:hypothetical protein
MMINPDFRFAVQPSGSRIFLSQIPGIGRQIILFGERSSAARHWQAACKPPFNEKAHRAGEKRLESSEYAMIGGIRISLMNRRSHEHALFCRAHGYVGEFL